MVRKNQIRKYTIQKIMELVSTETNGEVLTIYSEVISDKNKILHEKRQSLLEQLEAIRTAIEKSIRQMNEGVKDRIGKKNKLIMDKRSRPTNDHIKELSDLFAYMQQCRHTANRNNQDIQQYLAIVNQKDEDLAKKTNIEKSYADLDEQYIQLSQQCDQQIEVRDVLISERNQKLKHYSYILNSMGEFRVQYDIIESKIGVEERKLVQLKSYYSARRNEDRQKLQNMQSVTMSLQCQLLKSQTIVNQNSSKCQELSILQLEANIKKPE